MPTAKQVRKIVIFRLFPHPHRLKILVDMDFKMSTVCLNLFSSLGTFSVSLKFVKFPGILKSNDVIAKLNLFSVFQFAIIDVLM